MDINKILEELDDSSNFEIERALSFLQNDYNITKENIINLTKRLDNTELLYNKILSEYNKRRGIK